MTRVNYLADFLRRSAPQIFGKKFGFKIDACVLSHRKIPCCTVKSAKKIKRSHHKIPCCTVKSAKKIATLQRCPKPIRRGISRMADFVETQATEKKSGSKKRGRAPPGGFSPQKSPQPYKPKKITHAAASRVSSPSRRRGTDELRVC